ncbi:MAG: hypothetical protein M3M94_00010 [Actinomycetota bacterium]|nr:hypothetical protein [Actinomycetota bacterium]
MFAGIVVAGVAAAKRVLAPSLEASGPPPGARIGRAALGRLSFSVRARRTELSKQRWLLDGRDVTGLVRSRANELVFRPRGLADGRHRFEIRVGGAPLGATAVRRWTFVVDRKPPAIRLARRPSARVLHPLVLEGIAEAGARVTASGRDVRVDGDGRFSVRYAAPAPRSVLLTATDTAGNTDRRRVEIVLVPRRPPMPIRAVHVTAAAWGARVLRAGVLRLIDERRINAVELDLKDESGVVGWNAPVPLAHKIGAVRPMYDLRAAVRHLHARGVRVIGRLVCFRDPIHASAAWRAGQRDQVVQTPDGSIYAGYGGFTNFANPVVRRYNIDLAAAAARAGVDEILYDYVRRPDGPRTSMVFPALGGTPERSLAGFLAETRRALRPYRTFLGASVFGVAATRPREVAQDIPVMARHVDYIAPMLYPSHWARGEYGVSHPNAEPYAIVRRSLADFKDDVAGTGARVVPWLQDFSLGITYGPAEVAAQIRAARHEGINEFILWDPAVTYTAEALTRDAPREPVRR